MGSAAVTLGKSPPSVSVENTEHDMPPQELLKGLIETNPGPKLKVRTPQKIEKMEQVEDLKKRFPKAINIYHFPRPEYNCHFCKKLFFKKQNVKVQLKLEKDLGQEWYNYQEENQEEEEIIS